MISVEDAKKSTSLVKKLISDYRICICCDSKLDTSKRSSSKCTKLGSIDAIWIKASKRCHDVRYGFTNSWRGLSASSIGEAVDLRVLAKVCWSNDTTCPTGVLPCWVDQ